MANTEQVAPPKKRRETSMPHPVIVMDLELRSQEAQRLYNRTFEATNTSLLWLDVVLDKVSQQSLSLGDEEEVRFSQVLVMIEERLDEYAQRLDEELDRLINLRESHGLTLNIGHKNTLLVSAEVNSGLAMKYLNLFPKMDDVMEEVFILHFGGVLNRNQRKEAANTYRREIHQLSRFIIDCNTRAQDSNRKLKDGPDDETESGNEFSSGAVEDTEITSTNQQTEAETEVLIEIAEPESNVA